LTFILHVLSPTLLSIVCIRFFLFLTCDDGSVVIETERRAEVFEDFRTLEGEEVSTTLNVDLCKHRHLRMVPSDLTEVPVEGRLLLPNLF
jgi:hypothetical protein